MMNIFIQRLLQKWWKEGIKTKKDVQDPNVIDKTTKINVKVNLRGKLERA